MPVKKYSMKFFITGFFIILGVLTLLKIGYHLFYSPTKTKMGGKRGIEKNFMNVIPVKVVNPIKKELHDTLLFSGDLKAENEIQIYPNVTGKIISFFVNEGDQIKKGAVVATLQRDLVGYTTIPVEVRSPINGIIGRRLVDEGTLVTAQTSLAQVVTLGRMTMEMRVPEQDFYRIVPGQKVFAEVLAVKGKVYEGKVKRLSPVIERNTRTAYAELVFENNQDELKSGMFAKVKLIVRSSSNGMSIPSEVLKYDETGFFVWKINEQNKANKEYVEVGIKESHWVQILNGLSEHESIVLAGGENLFDGALCKIIANEKVSAKSN